jgi:hypothetical protein
VSFELREVNKTVMDAAPNLGDDWLSNRTGDTEKDSARLDWDTE